MTDACCIYVQSLVVDGKSLLCIVVMQVVTVVLIEL